MLLGCNIIQGCQIDDDKAGDDGSERPFSFTLRLKPFSGRTHSPSYQHTPTDEGDMGIISMADDHRQNRYLCLAPDSEDSHNIWMNAIARCLQTPEEVGEAKGDL